MLSHLVLTKELGIEYEKKKNVEDENTKRKQKGGSETHLGFFSFFVLFTATLFFFFFFADYFVFVFSTHPTPYSPFAFYCFVLFVFANLLLLWSCQTKTVFTNIFCNRLMRKKNPFVTNTRFELEKKKREKKNKQTDRQI